MRKFFFALCVAALHATPSVAATLTVENGQLVGATGVVVGDDIFDIEITNQTCVEVYDGCNEASDFVFFDLEVARSAGRALFDQVLIDGPLGAFDSQPNSVNGCDFIASCILQTPWANPTLSGFALGFFGAINSRSIETVGQNDIVTFGGGPNSFIAETDSITRAIVVWTPVSSGTVEPPVQPSAVPLPGAGALLIMGLLGGFGANIVRQRRRL